MFKVIGFIVMLAVFFIGYPAINRWYSGEATPKETVEEVRNRVGTALITDDKQNIEPKKSPEESPSPSSKSDDSRDSTSADNLLKKMMKE
jgi:hypothetical protein